MTEAFNSDEVSKHDSPQDAWVVVDGRVCDVTGFIRAHPGGLGVLEGHLGRDITNVLRSSDFHLHSRSAYEILDQCCIGRLHGALSQSKVREYIPIIFVSLDLSGSFWSVSV